MITDKIKHSAYILKMIPGILFLFTIGIISKYLAKFIPNISHLIIAIALGIITANFIKLPDIFEVGIYRTHKLWLKTGIVILGGRIILADFLNLGPTLLLLVIVFIVLSLLCVEFLAKRFHLDPKLGSLLSSGTSVCGVSAVIATGGAIEASESFIAYAVATVLSFDIITVFSYPIIGKIFSIPAQVYGTWAGISMFSTGTTVAAGFAHSDKAGQLSTIIKMTRNIFIGIWALLYSLYYTRKGSLKHNVENKLKYLWTKFPKIIIGFLIVMILANLGILSTSDCECLKNAYNWLFLLAFVGLGYSIDVKKLRLTGLKPFFVVLIAFIIVSITSLSVSYILFA